MSYKSLLKLNVGLNNKIDRDKWLKSKLQEISAGKKILDAGAGELQYKKFCEHLDYTSQDFGNYDGTGDGKGIQKKKWDNSKIDIKSDITNIPVNDNFFDAIMCIEVFEHIPNPIKALEEFKRILKPGGKLILTAPFCSLTHYAPYFYGTGFSRYWYEKFLVDNNFTIEEITPNGNFFEYIAQEMRRLNNMKIKYTSIKKPLNFFHKIILFFTLNLLAKLSAHNKGSEEVLCYGLQILATKKNDNY